TLIGTTDTLCGEEPDALTVTPGDTDYLLVGHNHYLAPAVQQNDIINSFVGLRPLIRGRTEEPSALSREFRLFESPSGLLSVAGGKYTTYRRMAETITNVVAHRLGRRRLPRTRHFALVGAPPGPWEDFERAESARLRSRYKLSDESARHLVRRYGRCAGDVAAYLDHDPALGQAVALPEPDLRAEFAYQRDHEMALCATDLLLRRTRLGLFRPELLREPNSRTTHRA